VKRRLVHLTLSTAVLLSMAGRPARVLAAEPPPGAAATSAATPEGSVAATQPSPSGATCASSGACVGRHGYGSVCSDGRCGAYLDRTDLLDILHLASKKAPEPTPFKLYPALIPAIGYNPALGFLIGVVGTFGMYLGPPDETTMSSAAGLVLVTSNKQLVVQLGTTLMTARNDWELQGDWRFLIYNQDTYGLGTDTPPVTSGFTLNGWGTTAGIAGGQPMDFDLIRIHETILRNVLVPNLYVGGSFRFDRYFEIVDEALDLAAAPAVVTSHYAYSTVYGFDPSAYTLSGVGADVLYDSRDSSIAPYRGLYAHLGFRGYPTWLGSSQASTMASGELRAYVGLSDDVPRNVLAFWVMASGVTSGHQPYLALPSIAWDAKGTTGRGYVQGRFRGTAEVYLEAEWRFRITDNGFLGGAVFANAETFSRPAVSLPAYGYAQPASDLFQVVKPAGGLGLRFMMNKESRTAVRLDFGWGVDSFAVYLGAGEVF
jgi:hypothetical protein